MISSQKNREKSMKWWLIGLMSISLFAADKYYQYGDLNERYDGALVEVKTQALANGIGQFYYDSGKLKGETPFKNGIREGIGKTYYDSGRLKGETPFHNDKIEGMKKEYYESGTLLSETPFVSDNAEGLAKFYYPTGTLQGESFFKHNRADGMTKLYNKSGKLIRTIEFKEGIVIKAFDYNALGEAKAIDPKLVKVEADENTTAE